MPARPKPRRRPSEIMCGAPDCGHEGHKKSPSRSRNWSGPFAKTPGRLLGMGLIRVYQLTLSGFIGNSCRHIPTCSEYGYEAIARHGFWPGGWMTLFRVVRCGPGGTGGLDPVQEVLESRQHWWMPWRYWRKHRKTAS